MINISEYSLFFINKNFNLPEYKFKKKIKKIKKYDYLFYEIFHKINKLDISSFNKYDESQEKIKLSDKINNLKIKNKDEILNNLLYEDSINLITLNAIIKSYNTNLIYYQDNVYYKMCYNDNDIPLVITNNYQFVNKDNFDNLYEITNLEKPLNSISYYKVNELINFAIKLKLPYEKIKKIDLYNSIYNYLVKLNIFKID
jgi:hypothetical protein